METLLVCAVSALLLAFGAWLTRRGREFERNQIKRSQAAQAARIEQAEKDRTAAHIWAELAYPNHLSIRQLLRRYWNEDYANDEYLGPPDVIVKFRALDRDEEVHLWGHERIADLEAYDSDVSSMVRRAKYQQMQRLEAEQEEEKERMAIAMEQAKLQERLNQQIVVDLKNLPRP